MQSCLLFAVFGLVVALVTASPAIGPKPTDGPVHLCLIACGVCFDNADDLMMECANEVCLQFLPAGKRLPLIWTKSCPMLGKIWKSRP